MSLHRAIVVISLAVDDAAQIAETLEALDPPNVPHFGGQVRVAVDPYASRVLDWLDS